MSPFWMGLAGAVTVLGSSVGWAQNYQLPPTYGQTTLVAGFLPDPTAVPLDAGGRSTPINVSATGIVDATTGQACGQSFVADAPDYRVQYTQGAGLLRFYVVTADGSDATLLVNAPDGSWHCNDDAFGTLMPAIDFNSPPGGQYDIWVGTYQPTAATPATLYITELAENTPVGMQALVEPAATNPDTLVADQAGNNQAAVVAMATAVEQALRSGNAASLSSYFPSNVGEPIVVTEIINCPDPDVASSVPPFTQEPDGFCSRRRELASDEQVQAYFADVGTWGYEVQGMGAPQYQEPCVVNPQVDRAGGHAWILLEQVCGWGEMGSLWALDSIRIFVGD